MSHSTSCMPYSINVSFPVRFDLVVSPVICVPCCAYISFCVCPTPCEYPIPCVYPTPYVSQSVCVSHSYISPRVCVSYFMCISLLYLNLCIFHSGHSGCIPLRGYSTPCVFYSVCVPLRLSHSVCIPLGVCPILCVSHSYILLRASHSMYPMSQSMYPISCMSYFMCPTPRISHVSPTCISHSSYVQPLLCPTLCVLLRSPSMSHSV